MNIYPFQAWYPNFEQIPSVDAFFGTVKDKFTSYQQDGSFKQVPESAIFIHRIQTRKRTYTGLMTCTSIDEYDKGNMIKHEKTITLKEQKTKTLLLERQASVKPVLLTYPAIAAVTKILHSYIQKHPSFYHAYFEIDQQAHQVWKIAEEEIIKELQQLFKKEVPTTYIADGHHRTATMSSLKKQFHQQTDKGDFSQLLVALFGSDQLEINVFNRVVLGLQDRTASAFLEQLSQIGTVTKLRKPKKPKQKHDLVLFLEEEWYRFRWKDALLEVPNKELLLDVTLLNDHVLNGILGMKDIGNDQRIDYLEGTKGLAGLKAATLKNAANIGFSLYPIQPNEFMEMAQQDILLPPKSTYFEPRIKNGLLVKRF